MTTSQFRKLFVDATTCRFGKFSDLEFYMHSKVRICVRVSQSLGPEFWATDGGKNQRATGCADVQELGNWLAMQGARRIKKPRPFRALRSIYD